MTHVIIIDRKADHLKQAINELYAALARMDRWQCDLNGRSIPPAQEIEHGIQSIRQTLKEIER